MYLTFDDALTALAEENYHKGIFNGTFTNPDGCAIRGTHFISARANDYSLVSKKIHWTLNIIFYSMAKKNPNLTNTNLSILISGK